MVFACAVLSCALLGPSNRATLHFRIPRHCRGGAARYLETIKLGPLPRKRLPDMPTSVLQLARTGNISRPLTASERRELKALFLWAAKHDRRRGSADDHYILLEAPVYRLLVKEFPGTEAAWEEWQQADLFDIAYILDHNLTSRQAWKWRDARDAKNAREQARAPR